MSKFCPYIRGTRNKARPLEQGKWIFYVWISQFFSFRLTSKKFPNCPKLSRNFPTIQNCPKKRKILYLIKLVSKGQGGIRKRHTDFLAFNFMRPLNSAAETLTFLRKCRHGIEKSMQTWKSGLKFFWNVPCNLSPQNSKVLQLKFIYRTLTRNCVGEIAYVKFYVWTSDLWPRPASYQG